ncbi:MAG: hypothetical protein UT26_C0030G0005 [Microgenomates group bacterium GW2011_GWC1_39_12]|nr:MAG: hypothetical protein UT26_C0030G0005 [Microgenomates group bacterium GW2011_GWC1_39_12]
MIGCEHDMARVQTVDPKKKKSNTVPTQNPKSKAELAKTNPKREPSKNEVMFFRIGMSVIALTLVILAIVLVIQYFVKQDEETGPFDDYISINANDLLVITQEDEYGVFGDFSYFDGKEVYEDLRTVLYSNDFIYVYFYRSSDINEELETAILAIEGLSDMAFLFVDLDTETTLFETPGLEHLNLDDTRDNMLLIFDLNAQEFQLEIRVSDILIEINKL